MCLQAELSSRPLNNTAGSVANIATSWYGRSIVLFYFPYQSCDRWVYVSEVGAMCSDRQTGVISVVVTNDGRDRGRLGGFLYNIHFQSTVMMGVSENEVYMI